ncbi:hypothetical protein BB560_002468 [Smittium megazygosporum]|uniref:Uncharacterized protein n=1 Tax=Smittium megazygosporum TaxID=133381 RepID=A0A2T9ZES0_9FUNG|nr:hypothetical protein BB560_002468 [Smittium megazygosporum]
MTSMVAIIPIRLVNILTDISINPYLQSILVEEQVNVIRRYGAPVTSFTLSKMEKLAAFVDESIVLSSSATTLYRRVKKPIFLSNGTRISNDQYISANMFENFHSKKDEFENRIFDIEKHFNGDITPDERFLRDNVWGYGSDKGWFRTKHPGYRQIMLVVPETEHMYLRRRKFEI